MQCEEFEDRINAVLDERRRPQWDAELSLHCETCGDCRKLAETYDHLLDGFYALATPPCPDDLALRVLVDLQNERAPRRRFSRRTAVMATAAALLVALGPLVLSQRNSGVATANLEKQTIQVAAALPPKAPLSELPLVPEFLSMTSQESGDPFAGLAKGTGQGIANVMLFVPGIGGGKGIMDAPHKVPDEPSWTEPMSEGLRPITNTVTETFDLLIESLPVSQFAARS
ncbi:MAG: hypothetical protein WD845_16680 [Pirellulales bacterium]